MTRVKICGITNLADALHATACGAQMLGFNLYRKSPRYIAPAEIKKITAALPASIETIGVFVNEAAPEVVRRITGEAGLQSVQLHGDESPEFCGALQDLNVIKAIRVSGVDVVRTAAAFSEYRILLDSPSCNFGGSGQKFDWEIARKVRAQVRYLILAGGLDADSVGDAIRLVKPDAVDACSLLESAPGVKDQSAVQRFVAMAHGIPARAGASSLE